MIKKKKFEFKDVRITFRTTKKLKKRAESVAKKNNYRSTGELIHDILEKAFKSIL